MGGCRKLELITTFALNLRLEGWGWDDRGHILSVLCERISCFEHAALGAFVGTRVKLFPNNYFASCLSLLTPISRGNHESE